MDYLKKMLVGRLNRRNFIFGWMTITVLTVLGLLFVVFVIIVNVPLPAFIDFILVFILIAFNFFTTLSLFTRRFHDLGKGDLYGYLCFVPYINTLVLIYLCFAKGQTEPNAYGEPQTERQNPLDIILNRVN